MDYLATITQFKLLETKNNLIFHLKDLGKELEKFKTTRAKPPEEFKEEYGFTCFVIEIIDLMLKYLFKVGRTKCNYSSHSLTQPKNRLLIP